MNANAPTSEHIVKSYDEELHRLTGEIQRMGEIALAQLDAAIDAVLERDSDSARKVVQSDAAIDTLEHDVSHDVVRLLALRQPMARDLREILAALRIAADIERIGDYAANVAKRSIVLNQSAPVQLAYALPRLARLAENLVREVLAAYRENDADRALEAWTRDEELDEQYTGLFRELLTYMMEDPRNITPCTHLLFMAKNLERIGDHATNIAENVYFLVHGTQIAQTRRKGRRHIQPVHDRRSALTRGSPIRRASLREIEIHRLAAEPAQVAPGHRHVGTDDFELEVVGPDLALAGQQEAERDVDRVLRHVEHDFAALPRRVADQRPVVHVVEGQRAVAGAVHAHPHLAPARLLGAQETGQAHALAAVGVGVDHLGQRAETGAVGFRADEGTAVAGTAVADLIAHLIVGRARAGDAPAGGNLGVRGARDRAGDQQCQA